MYYYIRRMGGLAADYDSGFWIQQFKSYSESNINSQRWAFRHPVRMMRPTVIYSSNGKRMSSIYKTVIPKTMILNAHELIRKIFENLDEW